MTDLYSELHELLMDNFLDLHSIKYKMENIEDRQREIVNLLTRGNVVRLDSKCRAELLRRIGANGPEAGS